MIPIKTQREISRNPFIIKMKRVQEHFPSNAYHMNHNIGYEALKILFMFAEAKLISLRQMRVCFSH